MQRLKNGGLAVKERWDTEANSWKKINFGWSRKSRDQTWNERYEKKNPYCVLSSSTLKHFAPKHYWEMERENFQVKTRLGVGFLSSRSTGIVLGTNKNRKEIEQNNQKLLFLYKLDISLSHLISLVMELGMRHRFVINEQITKYYSFAIRVRWLLRLLWQRRAGRWGWT